MITEIYLDNYKGYRAFRLPLNPTMNLIVGDNEAGKSTILESINLALTCRLNGRQLIYELSPYLFNRPCVEEFLANLKADKNPELPKVTIELYLKDLPEFAKLKGSNNSKKENCPGIVLEIAFDPDYKKEYEALIVEKDKLKTIPIEFYRVNWHSFAFEALTAKSMPLGASFIDATTIRLQTGTDFYLQTAISESLDAKERAGLSVAYRGLKEGFADEPSIKTINKRLAAYKSIISARSLNISVDVSQKANWETGLIPYLDQLPFQFIGRGEQSIIKTLLALERKAEKTQVVLIEEPENHLSFSSMNQLIKWISQTWDGKQLILTTHSPYVLNKLGLNNLILLSAGKHTSLAHLSDDTQKYFMKLPGFDTLRLILSKQAILVEGPSDELIVQRAYMDTHNGRLPLEDGIDVISVRALSFLRFLEIAKELKKSVRVVTDNDGDYASNVEKKYSVYIGEPWFTLCADKDNTLNTLEVHLGRVNDLKHLNDVLGKKYADTDAAIDGMIADKTENAMRIFDSDKNLTYPQYIKDAVA